MKASSLTMGGLRYFDRAIIEVVQWLYVILWDVYNIAWLLDKVMLFLLYIRISKGKTIDFLVGCAYQ